VQIPNLFSNIVNVFFNNFKLINFQFTIPNTSHVSAEIATYPKLNNNQTFFSENMSSLFSLQNKGLESNELSNSYRFTRFSNPLISYNYKKGDYLGITRKLYPHLLTSFIEVTGSVRKASWFRSSDYQELFNISFKDFLSKFTGVKLSRPGD
jgi:sulfite reductase alpha subunit-like flavoprotein